ncbi:pilus assembly FimT family protein [Noviluteimonas dokdonensis]|nr:prepilin-type N-terminal cleavage/methylation domain-containing protein [Lysobacter dokdonensis]
MHAATARGFTLVELIVALAVFAILATLAVPAFTAYFERTRLRAAADAVASLIGDARIGAVKQGRAVTVRFGGGGTQWCVGAREAAMPPVGMPMAGRATCDCTAAVGACVVDARTAVVTSAMHRGVALVVPGDALEFDGASGTRVGAPGSGAQLASRTGQFALTLAVSPMGQVSMCSRGGAFAGVPAC